MVNVAGAWCERRAHHLPIFASVWFAANSLCIGLAHWDTPLAARSNTLTIFKECATTTFSAVLFVICKFTGAATGSFACTKLVRIVHHKPFAHTFFWLAHTCLCQFQCTCLCTSCASVFVTAPSATGCTTAYRPALEGPAFIWFSRNDEIINFCPAIFAVRACTKTTCVRTTVDEKSSLP